MSPAVLVARRRRRSHHRLKRSPRPYVLDVAVGRDQPVEPVRGLGFHRLPCAPGRCRGTPHARPVPSARRPRTRRRGCPSPGRRADPRRRRRRRRSGPARTAPRSAVRGERGSHPHDALSLSPPRTPRGRCSPPPGLGRRRSTTPRRTARRPASPPAGHRGNRRTGQRPVPALTRITLHCGSAPARNACRAGSTRARICVTRCDRSRDGWTPRP